MNAIRAIHPYRHDGLWVFDDETVGLRQELFVAGADGILVWMRDPAVYSVMGEGHEIMRFSRLPPATNPQESACRAFHDRRQGSSRNPAAHRARRIDPVAT